jgi:YesN/AraC family two-component response regulator
MHGSELKEIIQDHVDTNLSLSGISRDLSINPSYLSKRIF